MRALVVLDEAGGGAESEPERLPDLGGGVAFDKGLEGEASLLSSTISISFLKKRNESRH